MEGLKTFLESSGLSVQDVRNISYGKKLSLAVGTKSAKINIFYGKRGFSVVKSPKCGTNKELNDLAADLISSYLYQI